MTRRHSVFNHPPGARTGFVLSSPGLMADFWSRTDGSAGPQGCWPWTGNRDTRGYGYFMADGFKLRASRLALEIHMRRPIGEGLFVLHSCDNPPCCNPAHLREGTPAENTNDSMARGRWPRGDRSHYAKLTEADAVAIKAAGANYTKGLYRRLAKQYGITPRAVSFITSGRRWSHVLVPYVCAAVTP